MLKKKRTDIKKHRHASTKHARIGFYNLIEPQQMKDSRSKQSSQNTVQSQSQTGISSILSTDLHSTRCSYRMRSCSHRKPLRYRTSNMSYLKYLKTTNSTK